MGAGALDGVVVLDLTQVLAGPYCTMLLADHGADVIKVEPPHGDLSRSLGAFFPEDVAKAESGYFHSINHKRSMVLDLKSVTGRDTFLALVARVDVVVENFRVGVMDRLGLSFETLREHNPRLVYAASVVLAIHAPGAAPTRRGRLSTSSPRPWAVSWASRGQVRR